MLEKVGNWNFDIFLFDRLTNGKWRVWLTQIPVYSRRLYWWYSHWWVVAFISLGYEPSAGSTTPFCPCFSDWSISPESHSHNFIFSLLLAVIKSYNHHPSYNATIVDNPTRNCRFLFWFLFWIVAIHNDVFWYCIPALIATGMW